MNSDFILLNKTYQTNDYIYKILINFPKKDMVLRNYLENCLYKLVENLFAFNINDTLRIKEKYLKEYLINLSMINYLIHQAFLKKYISYKQSTKVGSILLDLKKIAFTIMKGYNIHDKI